MAKTEAVDTTRLCARCDPAQFDFETTASLPEPADVFGQARAVDAVRLALDIAGRGFNLFVLREPGSGRHGVVRRRAAGRDDPGGQRGASHAA